MSAPECGSSAPLDRAEPVVAEVGVEDADGTPDLRRVAKVGKGCIAARPNVFERDRVLAIDAQRERRIRAQDVVVSSRAGRTEPAHEIFASEQIERGRFAEYHAQRGQRLRRDAVVVVGGARAVDGADSGVARAEEDRALQRDRVRKPPLAGRAERQRRARYAKDLRGDEVVTAVESPHTTV